MSEQSDTPDVKLAYLERLFKQLLSVLRQYSPPNAKENPLLSKRIDDLIATTELLVTINNRADIPEEQDSSEPEIVPQQSTTGSDKKQAHRGTKRKRSTIETDSTMENRILSKWVEVPEKVPIGPGRPADPLPIEFTKPCYPKATGVPKDKNGTHFYCIGCGDGWAGPRNRPRLLKHASGCHGLGEKIVKEVQASMIKDAPGTKRELLEEAEKQKIGGIGSKQRLKILGDDATVKLFCICGLPDRLADSPYWKEYNSILNPEYQPVSSTTLRDSHIPKEALRVRAKTFEYLNTQRHLTLSFDGNTTKGSQSIYTFHVSTPDRKTFFVLGDEASGESHTAEYILSCAERVFKDVDVKCFSGVVSDNTGNTKKARQLICSKYPWIINVIDSPHFLARTLHDICGLEMYKKTIEQIRPIITFFRHSTYATTHLNEARAKLGISRGIEKIGKTRFGSIFLAANSLLRCRQAIESVVENGLVTSKDIVPYFSPVGPHKWTSRTFERDLLHLVTVCAPIAKSLQCLEAPESTCATVLLFWLASAASLNDIFDNPDTGLNPYQEGFIRASFNRRFEMMFDEPPDDVYWAALLLDRHMIPYQELFKGRHVNPYRKPGQPQASDAHIEKSPAQVRFLDEIKDHPMRTVIVRVSNFLCHQLRVERARGHHPILNETSEFNMHETFYVQFTAWIKRDSPFDRAIGKDETARSWWRKTGKLKGAELMGLLGEKLDSIIPNSMTDERTTSTITWINSSLRNRQHVRTIVDKVQIRQFYLNDPNSDSTRRPNRPVLTFRDLESFRTPVTASREGEKQQIARSGIGNGRDDADLVEDFEEHGPNESWEDDGFNGGRDAELAAGQVANLQHTLLLDVLSDKPLVEPPQPRSGHRTLKLTFQGKT